MPSAILALVIVALLVERTLANRAHATEVRKLTNALIARTPGELVALNREPERPKLPKTADPVPEQVGL